MKTRLLFAFLLLSFIAGLLLLTLRPSSPFRSHLTEAYFLGNGTGYIRVWGTAEAATQSNYIEELRLQITGVSLHPFLATDAYRACIDSIHVSTLVYQVESYQISDGANLQIQNDQPCIDFSVDANYDSYKYFPLDLEMNLETGSPQNAAFFNYPYDQTLLKADITFYGKLYDEGGSVIDTFDSLTSQTFGATSPGWEIHEIRTSPDLSGTGIILKRPFILRLLTPILLLLLFLAILCVPFVDAFSTAIQVAVALVLGIWGVRQTILPTDPPGTTAVDIILIGSYGAIIISLLTFPAIRFFKIITNVRKGKGAFSDGSLKTSAQYVGLPGSHVYHLSSCPMISRSSENGLLKYADRNHAEKSGKRLCQLCKVRRTT